MDWDSSVGIAIRYVLDRPVIESRGGQIGEDYCSIKRSDYLLLNCGWKDK
jgi:hypothetical protein